MESLSGTVHLRSFFHNRAGVRLRLVHGGVREWEPRLSTSAPSMSTPSTSPTHEEITRLAFQIWQENGRRPGSAHEDWHAAERELTRAREHRALNTSQDAQEVKHKTV